MEGRLYDLHLSADHPTRGSAGPRSAPRRKRHAPYAHDGRPLVHVDGRAVDEVAEYSLPNRTCDRRGGNRAHLPRRPADARRMRDIPPEKFEANSLGGDRQHEPRRKRRVRDIDLPIGRITPERAETYGLDYEKWYGSYQKALAVDLKKIQQAGAALARSLRGRKKIRIESDAGTDLRFETKAIVPIVSDGIISAEDIRRGFVRTALPAGRLEVAVRPESVNGDIRGTDPIPFAGRAIVRPWFQIRSGRIVESGASKHQDLLHRVLRPSKSKAARIGYFTIGLNEAAEPCMLDNSIVKDDVGLGLGPHPELERRIADPTVSFDWTVGPVRIEIPR